MLVDFFEKRLPDAIDLLEQLVKHESPTGNKVLVDRLGEFIHGVLVNLAADVQLIPRQEVGDIRLAKWNAAAPGQPILILVHIDTVWAAGTLESEVPLKVTDTHFYGPGALDMKGGITACLEALHGLQMLGQMPKRPIWMLVTSDEEVASTHSRALIEEIAPQTGLVLVPEPAGENEAVKTMRKGIGRYWVRSEGLASHSGNAPEAGINAIIDNAHQAIKLHNMNDLANGTSVSVTQISGGTAMNVIPPHSEMYVDVRFSQMAEAQRIHDTIMALEPTVLGAKLNVRGYIDRPPMERTDKIVAAFKQAKEIAKSLDLPLSEQFSGGGSDGNFTAALGVTTLDGLGPEGAGMHAKHEQVWLRTLPRRAALIAAILRDWKMD